MMRIQRDLSGSQLTAKLDALGYAQVRQSGSHLTLRTEVHGRHSVQIPLHKSLKVGTLSAILKNIADHHSLTLEELATILGLG